jgi:methionyl-tRNA formyltransferase
MGPSPQNCLILSPYEPAQLAFIVEAIKRTNDRPYISGHFIAESHWDWVISYGHRSIIKEPLLSRYRIINLHISYLPWNRGADPNLWSWIDNTPKGVTLHYVDAGVDTGDIIAQLEVTMSEAETLATSYVKLVRAAEALFTQTWPDLAANRSPRTPQPIAGTVHRAADAKHIHLPMGWDTPVSMLCRAASVRQQ